MDLQDSIIRAKTGGALVFFGAGFSLGAKNHNTDLENKIPTAPRFARYLGNKLGTPKEYPLPIIAGSFSKNQGEHKLLAELICTFTVAESSSYHDVISSLPWYRAYTTNYDNLFEFSARKAGRDWTPITIDEPVTSSKNRCVHINGHVNKLSIENLKALVKLTHSSYSADSFKDSPWSSQFLADMTVASAIFFVGYSLFDIDVARLLSQNPTLCQKTVFITSPDQDLIMLDQLIDYGSVHQIGTEAFADQIRLSGEPPPIDAHKFTWLEPYTITAPSRPSDRNILNVLFLGDIDPNHVAYSIANPETPYLIRRSEINEVLAQIHNGRRWFVLHSDLGNGKTAFCHQLSVELIANDYSVYWSSDFELNRASDMRHVSNLTTKIAIILESHSTRLDALQDLQSLNSSSAVVIVSIRTALYELGEVRYKDTLPDDYMIIDLNRISNEECGAISTQFDRLGLWGEEMADKNNFDKSFFIKTECSARMSSLIIALLETSDVGRKIKASAEAIFKTKDGFCRMLVLTFVLSRVNVDTKLSLMTEIIGEDAYSLMKSHRAQAAREFVGIRNDKISTKSSVLGSYLLREAAKPELVACCLSEFVCKLEYIRKPRTVYETIYREIQRFTIIEGLITGPRKRALLIGFYQSIKELPGCIRHPLFWLHYAITLLAFKEYKEANLYFAYARGCAKGGYEWTLRDIDNHYARLLLESRTNSDDFDDLIEAFEKAHNILYDQMLKGNNREYPYRQARGYIAFITTRIARLDKQEIKRFSSCCSKVKRAIESLDSNMSSRRDVKECYHAMERAMEICGRVGAKPK